MKWAARKIVYAFRDKQSSKAMKTWADIYEMGCKKDSICI